ncbi:MAG: peptidylprolyl isomerase [Bacteroidales bacterium]|nr:peptidylprolyl isomerase [Bacteroidales bacterium]
MFNKFVFYLLVTIVPLNLLSQDKEGVIAKLITKYGDINILLYNSTPLHQQNFIKLSNEGFYNDQLFHRVINNFMIQTGDPNSKGADKGEFLGSGGVDYSIPAEFRENLYHKKGAISAARKGDSVNPKRVSSGSQFYIVQGQIYSQEQLDGFVKTGRHKAFTSEEIKSYTTIGGTPHLDATYTVFGEVISGLSVLDTIASQPVDSYNRPIEDIKLQIKIIK